MKIQIEIDDENPDNMNRYVEIFNALLRSGGLSGVKQGRTILHFDADGIFQGVELNYWPWRRRTR